jgi:hypothetical protein
MKKNVLLIIIGLVLLAVGPLYGDNKAAEEGKFGLFNAIYNTATIQKTKTTIFLEKRLFKIDEKTGDTWMLIDNIRDGKDVKYWKKIDGSSR